MVPVDQQAFDTCIGRLDRILSELMLYTKQCTADLDKANLQTLKHHAEDMISCGQSMLKKLGVNPDGH